ncbi:MAG: CHASE3 domain-containing protein, partial [Bryobacteraceae bacterium]
MSAKDAQRGTPGWSFSLAQKIRLGFAVGIVIYLTAWGFAALSLVHWRRDADQLFRADQTLTQMERLSSRLDDAETATRQYVLTARQSYLAGFDAGIRDARQALLNLRSTQDVVPSLPARLDLIDEQLRIKIADRKGLTARGKAATDKVAIDKIRAAVGETVHDLHEILEKRSEQQVKTARDAQWRLLCSVILSLIMARIVWSRLVQAVQSREVTQAALLTSTAELREKTGLLENQNAEILRATQLKSEFLANMSHELRT